jgi:hypothetical protein
VTTQADVDEVRRLALDLPTADRAALGEAVVAGWITGMLEAAPGLADVDGGRFMRAEVRRTVEQMLGGPW